MVCNDSSSREASVMGDGQDLIWEGEMKRAEAINDVLLQS